MATINLSHIKSYIEKSRDYIKKHEETMFFYVKNLLVIIGILVLTYLTKKLFLIFPTDVQKSMCFVAIHGIINTILSFVLVIYPFTKISVRVYRRNPVWRDRFLFAHSGWGMAMYSVIAIIIVISFICAIANIWVGDATDIYDNKAKISNLAWGVISQFADPGNLPQTKGLSGSAIALLSAFAGILCLSGLVVSSLVSMIARRTQQWKSGQIHYTYGFKNYVVIIGINEQTPSIIRRSLKERDNVDYVLIQTKRDVEKARMEIELKLDRDLEEKVVFYSGERTSSEDIKKLKLEKALEVYILGEEISNSDEHDHDAFNIECLEHVATYLKDHIKERKTYFNDNNKVRVHVNFEYQSTFTAFKATHLYHKLGRDIDFVPFNVHEIWAKKILVDNFAIVPSGKDNEVTVQHYYPVDTYLGEGGKRIGITADCEKTVHLIILGMNQMGTALGTQAALLCHFPNFVRNINKRTTITFIDDHAKEEGDYLMGRFSTLFELCRRRTIICDGKNLKYYRDDEIEAKKQDENYVDFSDKIKEGYYSHLIEKEDKRESFLDIEWEFIQGDIASEEIQKYIADITKDPGKTTTIAICFNEPQQSIASAMYLPAEVYANVNQVLVYQQNSFDIANDVANGDVEWKRYPNLFPFGMIESAYTENQYDNHMAKLEHYIYMQGKDKVGNPNPITKDKYLLQNIDAQWDQLGIVQKLANIDMVDSISIKLRSMGEIDNYKGTQRYDSDIIKKEGERYEMIYTEHNRWMAERLVMGFRCLDEQEQKELINPELNSEDKKRRKAEYKDKKRAHLDICSNAKLKIVDEQMHKNDRVAIITLPELFECAEWVSVLRLSDDRYNRSQHVSVSRYFLVHDDKIQFSFIEGVDSKEEIENETRHSYWISQTEVTQDQWEKIMGKEKADNKGKDMPVVNVSKQEIDDFILILRKKTGLYFSLPSKKEWMYAAKMEAENRSKKADQITFGKMQEVHSDKCADSHYNLHHILGNVWEWTDSYLKKGTTGEIVEDSFYFCGGSWRFTELECDLEQGYWANSGDSSRKSDDLGFRLVWKFEKDGYKNDNNYAKVDDVLNFKKGGPAHTSSEQKLIDWFKKYKMKHINEGFFIMGANQDDEAYVDANETPRHAVYISQPFYMCEVPVTQSLWNAVTGTEPSSNPTENRIGEDIPQTDISWKDIMNKDKGFLCELNSLLKTNDSLRNSVALSIYPLPMNDSDEDINKAKRNAIKEQIKAGKLVFRLPTEAEWEYAAKGGNDDRIDKSKLFQDGYINSLQYENKYSVNIGELKPEEMIHVAENIIPRVKSLTVGNSGLYDMSGTVWEWCIDHYIFDMYDVCVKGKRNVNGKEEIVEPKDIQLDENSPTYKDRGYITDPVASATKYKAHVFRGGSWRSKTAWDCRCTRANFWIDSYRSNDLGFRLVLGCPIEKISCQ